MIQILIGWALIILFAAAPAIIVALAGMLLLSGVGAVVGGAVGRRPATLLGGLAIVGAFVAALTANILHAEAVARQADAAADAQQARTIAAFNAEPLPRAIAVWSGAPIDAYQFLGRGRFDEVWRVYGSFHHKDGGVVELDEQWLSPPDRGGNRLVRHRLAETPGCRERLLDQQAAFRDRQACLSSKGFLLSPAALDQDHLLILQRSGYGAGDGAFEILRGASGRYVVLGRCEDNRRAPSAMTHLTRFVDVGRYVAGWRHGDAYHRCIRQLRGALAGETTPPPKIALRPIEAA